MIECGRGACERMRDGSQAWRHDVVEFGKGSECGLAEFVGAGKGVHTQTGHERDGFGIVEQEWR